MLNMLFFIDSMVSRAKTKRGLLVINDLTKGYIINRKQSLVF